MRDYKTMVANLGRFMQKGVGIDEFENGYCQGILEALEFLGVATRQEIDAIYNDARDNGIDFDSDDIKDCLR